MRQRKALAGPMRKNELPQVGSFVSAEPDSRLSEQVLDVHQL